VDFKKATKLGVIFRGGLDLHINSSKRDKTST